jgi:riboflavin synthase alpha subunit
VPPALGRYIARKGSVCLTVEPDRKRRFGKSIRRQLVPRTLDVTVLGEYRPGTRLNVSGHHCAT